MNDTPKNEKVAAWLTGAIERMQDERYERLIRSEKPGSHMHAVYTQMLESARFKLKIAIEKEAIRLAKAKHEDQFGMAAAVERIERSTEILERAARWQGVWIDAPFDTALRQTIQINRWWLEQRNADATT